MDKQLKKGLSENEAWLFVYCFAVFDDELLYCNVFFLVMIPHVYVNWIGSGQGFLFFLRENFFIYLKIGGVGAVVGSIFWFFYYR